MVIVALLVGWLLFAAIFCRVCGAGRREMPSDPTRLRLDFDEIIAHNWAQPPLSPWCGSTPATKRAAPGDRAS